MKVGYARISTPAQDLTMQIEALEKAGCEKIYQEVGTGRNFKRLVLNECLNSLKEGDCLVVWALDRVGRSNLDLMNVVHDLEKRGIGFKSLKEGIDNIRDSTSKILLSVFSILAETEHNRVCERSRAGMEIARARGRFGGRSFKLSKSKEMLLKDMYESRKYTLKQIASAFDISRATVYQYINRKPKEKK